MKKVKDMVLDGDDDTSRYIKQLGLLSLLPGFDKKVIRVATSKLLTDIVTGEEKAKPSRGWKHRPSRFSKRVRDRYKKRQMYMARAEESEPLALQTVPTNTTGTP